MKTIIKADAEYISKRFYDFYDKVWEVIKEMTQIKNDVEKFQGKEEVSLNHYCIARHDKNVIVANFYSSRTNHKEIQFPLNYLYEKSWQAEYRNKLIKEKEKDVQSIEKYNKERDLNEIKRLKKLYPDQFK